MMIDRFLNKGYKKSMMRIRKYITVLLMGFLLFFQACSLWKVPEEKPEPPKEEIVSTLPEKEDSSLPEAKPIEPAPEEELISESLPEIDGNSIEGIGAKDSIGFGVMMTTDETKPGVPQSWINLFKQYQGYYVAPTQEKKIYLTFDLGYESGYTASLLDTLQELAIPGTFFLLGQYIEKNPDLVKRIVSEGYAVGNHSTLHESIPTLTKEEIIEDTQHCQKLFHDLTHRVMHLYRPPKGEFSEYSLSIIHQLGYKSIFWSVAYQDWVALPGGPEESYETVIKHIHPGAIILMHVVTDDNVLALPNIVQSLTEKGYTFASLDEL